MAFPGTSFQTINPMAGGPASLQQPAPSGTLPGGISPQDGAALMMLQGLGRPSPFMRLGSLPPIGPQQQTQVQQQPVPAAPPPPRADMDLELMAQLLRGSKLVNTDAGPTLFSSNADFLNFSAP